MTLTHLMCRSLAQAFHLIFVLLKHCCRDSQLIKPRQVHSYCPWFPGLTLIRITLWAFDEQLLTLLPGLTAIIEHKVQITDSTCALNYATRNSFFTLYGQHATEWCQCRRQRNSTQPRRIFTDLFWLCGLSAWLEDFAMTIQLRNLFCQQQDARYCRAAIPGMRSSFILEAFYFLKNFTFVFTWPWILPSLPALEA